MWMWGGCGDQARRWVGDSEGRTFSEKKNYDRKWTVAPFPICTYMYIRGR